MAHRLTYRVYGMSASGNCHKVKLALDLLHLSYRWHETDSIKGDTRTPEFLAINPMGQVPVLQIDTGKYLIESNAIMCFLADDTALWPGDRLQRAQVLQWLFFEQYSHEPYIAVARALRVFRKTPDDPRMPKLLENGKAALAQMERHLAGQPFFGGSTFTIADIGLFAYTHKAEDGGFRLADYPAVSAWIARCLAVPGVTPMPTPALP
jgi:glutathione S-transferase